MLEERSLWDILLDVADQLLTGIPQFVNTLIEKLTTETIKGYSLLEIVLGVGIGTYITLLIAKWVIDFVD